MISSSFLRGPIFKGTILSMGTIFETKLSESSLVRVLWPQVRCRLLNAEVQILDSPGVDVTPDLDLWIDKYCLNADVFVLVGGFSNCLEFAANKRAPLKIR